MQLRVGLTGGIGSGKSEVARVWQAAGALIIDADLSAREAVAPGSSGLAEIAAMWPSVIDTDGALDRAKLGRIIFADDAQRLRLESIVHPVVRAIGERAESRARHDQVIVHVVPLLFEAGYAEHCARTVVVIAPESDRVARVMQRDDLSEAEVRMRMSRQIPQEQARLIASDVIENTGDLATLHQRARDLFTSFAQSRHRVIIPANSPSA